MSNRLIRTYDEILRDFEQKLNTKNHINESEKENSILLFVELLDKYHRNACELEKLLENVVNESPDDWTEKFRHLMFPSDGNNLVDFQVLSFDHSVSQDELFFEVEFFRELFDNPFQFKVFNKETPNKTLKFKFKMGDPLFSLSENRRGKVRTWSEEKKICVKKVSDYSKMKKFYFTSKDTIPGINAQGKL